eukprot:gene12006-16074_t
MPSNGLLQLSSCLQKITIEKRRNIRVTCCECFCHFLILIILVLGYGVSIIVYYPATIYSHFQLVVPPVVNVGSAVKILSGPLIAPSFDVYVGASKLLSSNSGSFGGFITQSAYGRTFTNLLYFGNLHFAPEGPALDNLLNYLNSTYVTFNTINTFTHQTEEDAISYIFNNLDQATLALIVLDEISTDKVSYKIRQNYTILPDTNTIVNFVSSGLDVSYQSYFLSGFATLERTMNQWIFQYTNVSINSVNLSNNSLLDCTTPPNPLYIPIPTFAYDQNPFYPSVGFLLGLAWVMETLYAMSRTVKSVVEEKETKIREIMKIMGLLDWVHQLSWFISTFLLFFWIAVSSTAFSSIFIAATSKILLFLYFFLFCMSEISFAFLISVFFSNSKIAAIVAPVSLFAAVLPKFIFIQTTSEEQIVQKVLASFLSPTAFAFGADILANYEYSGKGVQLNNIGEGGFSFAIVLFMLWIDFYIYGILALYLDQVIPQEYGTPKHPLFFLQWRYWCGSCSTDNNGINDLDMITGMPEFESSEQGNGTVEPISMESRNNAQVIIKSLKKRYPNGKLAVKDLSVSMVSGQITCLLGHNGAGKSTTISVLTGLIEPTNGQISIFGKSLAKDLPAIRQITGICPQHNVLYPTLTVYEHLRLFGNIKGMWGWRLQAAIDLMLKEIGLTEKIHYLSSQLSGGMKRKLSLAIALIGDPKFLLLDEPTSGMDPYSRRSTWELLQKCKANRVVLLTTHFMDEADTLADRIAIISDGRLRCSGSSLFLKNRFGVGYSLSLSKTSTDVPVEPIEQKVLSVIQNANITSSVAGEVIFRLPLSSVTLFADLFVMLKQYSSELGIGSFGVSITTLEQVFISLAKEDHLHENDDCDENEGFSKTGFMKIITLIGGFFQMLLCCCTALFRRNGIKVCDFASVNNIQDNNPLAPSPSLDYPMIELMDQSSNNYISVHPTIIAEEKEEKQGEQSDNNIIADPITIQSNTHLNEEFLINNSNASHDDNMLVAIEEIDSNPKATPYKKLIVPLHIESSNDNAMLDTALHLSNSSEFNSWNKVRVQTTELLRKRAIITRRDLKGFFFQVIFPALQVVLILLILIIRFNPAGHNLVLNGNLFKKYAGIVPTVLKSGVNNVTFSDDISTTNYMTVDLFRADNSTDLSNQLLQLSKFEDSRYGAYVFDDIVPVNITIDWNWVKNNLNIILQNQNTITSILNGFQIKLPLSGFTLSGQSLQLNIPTFNNTNALTDQLISIINNQFNLNITSAQGLINYLDNQFNISIPVNITNILNNLNNNNLTNLINNNNFKVTVGIGSFSFNSTTDIITFNNVTINGVSIPISISIPLVNVTNLLPNGVQMYEINVQSKYTVMHNSTCAHGALAFGSELIQTAFKQCGINNGYNPKYFKVNNHPLPITLKTSLEIKLILSILTALFLIVPFGFVPAAFVSFIVRERVSKSKHLQMVSGVSPQLYWTVTYIWDMLLYIILTLLILASLAGFGSSAAAFVGDVRTTGCFFLLLLLYGSSSIPLSYLYSFAFENHSTAQISVMAINFVTGFVMVLAYFIMANVPSAVAASKIAVHFFRIFPTYNLGEGIINIVVAQLVNVYLGSKSDYFDWKVAGRNITFLAAETVGYFLIILLLESKWLKSIGYAIEKKRSLAITPPPPPDSIDEDVLEEEQAVCSSNVTRADYSLLVQKLIKTYPPSIIGGQAKHAVKGVSFGCHQGERFGLLGINGAGKTTTLSVLTNDLQSTQGDVFIEGKSLSDSDTQQLLGYCPQVDPLLDLMTGFETLRFFGRIRGIPSDLLESRVQSLIHDVGLSKFADKCCGTYSGGNKRKLSLAVALIGDPRVLLLDEPSTGMDPEARRQMWNVIEHVSANRSVILVSHSMEEVEALCTRMCVMVSGRLKCIGSAQRLKSRFGEGYQVEIRCNAERMDELLEYLGSPSLIPDYVLIERHGGYVKLKVGIDIDLGAIFGSFESNKSFYSIYDYSISQCTLEQIFIQFAREQEEETHAVQGMS